MDGLAYKKLVKSCAVALLALIPAIAHAQVDGGDPVDSGDTAFVIAMALIALGLAVPGVILHHGARAGGRAFAATATQVGAIAAIVSVLWVVAGYTVAFGAVSKGWLGGGNAWMLIDLGNVRGMSAVPEIAFVLLQLAAAVMAAALLTGAWAERGNLAWIVPFAGLWSLMVYAPAAHWVWGGGWLATRLGTIDAGGALALHVTPGAAALVITLLMGRRAQHGTPGSPALAAAGTGMTWVALLALTAGGTLSASDEAATTLVNAQAAAAAGALVWLIADAVTGRGAGSGAWLRGGLAGLIGAAAAANAMAPGAALLAGLGGALVAWIAARLLHRVGIDDPVDLIAVHGAGGLAGALLAAPLIAGTLGGTGYPAGMTAVRQVVAQAIGAGVVVAWSVVGTAIAALMVAMVVPMRITETAETEPAA
jgi:ammonium transporter, Amt family